MNYKLDVPKTLSLLIKLQTVAGDAFHLDNEKESLKKSYQKIEMEYEDLNSSCDELNEQILQIEDKIKDHNNAIEQHLEVIKKLKDKEKLVKTQKEYIALDTEQTIKRDEIKEHEKLNQQLNKEKDDIKKDLDKKNNELSKLKEKLDKKKDDMELKIAEIDEKLKDIENVRTEVIPEIDPEMLNRFEFIVKNKDGIGIVPVISGICEGCNIAITPTLISVIIKKEEIVYCSNCARILYFPEKTSIF